MTQGSPRTQSLGDGIRVDHRSTCGASYPRCECPKSWAGPQRNGVRAKRRTGFIGTFTEAKAEKAADARRVVAGTPAVTPVLAGMPTLFEFAQRCLSDRFAPRRQISIDWYERPYRLRIHAHLGGLPLDRITFTEVRAWCDQLIEREGDRECAKDAFGTLRWLLGQAVAENLLSQNVAAGFPFDGRAASAVRQGAPSASDFRKKKPTLTREQYERVKDFAGSVALRELVMCRLVVEATLRRTELGGMKWSGFDPDARTFELTSGVTHTKTTGTVTGDLKTRTSSRFVVLGASLSRLLLDYRSVCVGGGEDNHFLFPGCLPYKRIPVPVRPACPRTLTGWICDLIRDAGVVDDEGQHYTDLQGLRATGASLAAAAGVPQALIQAQLGHRGASVYERHYLDVRLAPERFQFADVFDAPANAEAEVATESVDQRVDQRGVTAVETTL
ncbi:MAG: site-specific integrase [Thermoleophilia bacterium]|nr:site-specific integrase [Thermoleophilia bacterium]